MCIPSILSALDGTRIVALDCKDVSLAAVLKPLRGRPSESVAYSANHHQATVRDRAGVFPI